MKKTISLLLVHLMIASTISSSFARGVSNNLQSLEDTLKQTYKPTYQNNISIYGAGQSVTTVEGSDRTYKGFGIKYDSDYTEIVVEKGTDYKRASVVQRIDIGKHLYTKAGAGLLEREETILGKTKDVKQTTLGLALGYGDDKSYNIEVGHLRNKLSGAAAADTTTKISYAELVLKKDITSFDEKGNLLYDYGSIDFTFSGQTAKAYGKKVDDYSGSLGYYPIDDLKFALKYDSQEHDTDNYRATAGLNYKFAGFHDFSKGKLSPTFMFTKQAKEHLAYTIEYKENIANRSLKMRDKFEELVNTTAIVAKQVNPEEFKKKTTAAPVATFKNFTMAEDTTYVGKLTATDSNGLALTYAKLTDVEHGTLTLNADGAIIYTPNPDYFGTDSFKYSVSNGIHTVEQTVTITITDVVDDTVKPVVTLTGNSTINLNTGDTYTELGATANDNVDGALFVVITGTVNTAVAGTYTKTYTATDSAGNTATATRTIVVTDPTDSATSIVAPSLLSRGTSYINVDSWTFADDDGIRNITIEMYSDAGLTTLVDTKADGTFSGLSSSTTYYFVTKGEAKNGITDAWETKRSSATAITTNTPAPPPPPPNQAPTANAGADKSTTVNVAVTVTGSGTDSDGSIASYEWKEGSTVLSTNASFNYTPSTTGDHTLTLKVTDNDGATDTDTMTVTANAAISTPTISMANQSVNDEGGSSSNPVGTPTVTGAEAGAVYSFTSNPFGAMLTINSSTGQMTWNGDLFGDQTETIGIKILNLDGGEDTTTFSLEVIDNG